MFRFTCRTVVPVIALLWLAAGAEAAIVRGGAYLKGQDDHSNILVEFTRSAPTNYSHRVLTNASCHFTISVPPGTYTISFTHDGYFFRCLREVIIAEEEMRLPDILLVPWSTRLRVPLDFPTIQSAVDAARAADTVLVSPGRYGENLRFNGKLIVVGSHYLTTRDTSFISQTIIDGGGRGRVVTFTGGEDRRSMLCGFTLTNGRAPGTAGPDCLGGGVFFADNTAPHLLRLRITGNTADGGGGIHCGAGSHPLIECSDIRNNTSRYAGGGISCAASPLTLRNSRVEHNTAGSRGGGIFCDSADITVENGVIAGNRAEAEGGGICLSDSDPHIYGSTVYGNTASRGGGLACFSNSRPVLAGCIVAGNNGPGGIIAEGSSPSILRSDIYENEGSDFSGCDFALGGTGFRNDRGYPCDAYGNIRLDPRFLNPAVGDFRPGTLSPCIGTGPDTDFPTMDITGASRTLPYDMGAYEGSSTTTVSVLNASAGFSVDTDLCTIGCQNVCWAKGLEGNAPAGFAIYATRWDAVKRCTVTLSWDAARITFLGGNSGPEIPNERITLNGETFTPAFEPNLFGEDAICTELRNEPGICSFSCAAPGDKLTGALAAPLLFAAFHTADDFTLLDELSIRISVKITDQDGVETDLGERSFHILPESEIIPEPPSNIAIQDIPGDQGHSLKVTWSLSASEHLGYVTRYRIFRSRSSDFTSPIPLSRFSTLDSLLYYEERHPILIDSVAVGVGEFIDPFVPLNGVPYCYWVQAVGPSGVVSKPARTETRTAVEEQVEIPRVFTLGTAHPNPFNPSTVIEFSLAREARITLRIYNTAGQTVAELVRGVRSAGRHSIVWDARGMPSGVYFYSLRSDGLVETRKVTLLK